MKKQIEVIIKKKRPGQNNQQIIQKVSRGYAFNYLIPNQIAEIATKGKIKHIQMLNSLSHQKENLIHKLDLKINNDIINIQMIHIRKKCGQNHQIFGSISEHDIQEIILSTTGRKIEKKQILIQTIKQLGTYKCYIMVNDNIKTPINIRILPSYI